MRRKTFGVQPFNVVRLCLFAYFLVQKHFAAVLEKEEKVSLFRGVEKLVSIPVISPPTQIMLKGLFMVLRYLFKDNHRLVEQQGLSFPQRLIYTKLNMTIAGVCHALCRKPFFV